MSIKQKKHLTYKQQVLEKPEEGFTEEILKSWYHIHYRPAGSGPLGVMRVVCALIEEVAELKGIKL